MAEVIWKEIIGYEGLYKISNTGIVVAMEKSISCPHCKMSIKKPNKETVMKPSIKKNGYAQVNLTKDRIRTTFLVHRLVASHFIDNAEIDIENYTVHHKDFNKLNNNVDNLEWCYLEDNIKYSLDSGRLHAKNNKNKSPYHVRKKSHKLTPDIVSDIKERLNNGERARDVARELNISESSISSIKNNKQWINYNWESQNV